MLNAPIVSVLPSAVKTMIMCFRMFVGGVATMNEQQITLIRAVMEMIDGTLTRYRDDPHHAPADWILENWWATLNGVLRLELEVRDHADSKSHSFKATDEAESEKRDQNIESD